MIEKLKYCDGQWEDPTGCCHDSPADYLFCCVLPSCGCGDSSSIGRYVRDMFAKHVGRNGEGTEYDDLAAMFFLSWADREGYIEHGCTIRCSWLTDKGKELVGDLETVLSWQQATGDAGK